MEKLDLLRAISFGKRVAEEEAEELARYFHVTEQYKGVRSGETDIVYGLKGAGKSAMYVALKNESSKLIDEHVLLVAAENPRGAPAFKDLVSDPPATEQEFITLWKLYLLSLAVVNMKSFGVDNELSRKAFRVLEEAGLVTTDVSLSKIIRGALDAARRLLSPRDFSTSLELNEISGLPEGITAKITLQEPTQGEEKLGKISVDELFRLLDNALVDYGYKLWICIDRLDVAFAEREDLEANALRALFKVYRDIDNCTNLRLRIFLRSDIWARITKDGFREGSHLTRGTTITWSRNDLLHLVVRRMIQSNDLLTYYNLNRDSISSSFNEQKAFFYKVFPDRVYSGPNQSTTFDWILSRTEDATGFSAPREILHLLSAARDIQIKKLESGHATSTETALFDKQSIRDALFEVSKVRTEQTLFQEYPSLRDDILAFKGDKAEQTIKSITTAWHCDEREARTRAEKLMEVGFWRLLGEGENLRYKIPFLYRSYLNIKRGTANGDDDEEEV